MAGEKDFDGQRQTILSADELQHRFGEYADIMGSDITPEEKHQEELAFEKLIHANPSAYQELLEHMRADFESTTELSGAVATREVFFPLGDNSGTQG